MGAFFHIISTGGGSGSSRATRYIAERDKDLAREGHGTRPLFSEDRDGLSYTKADRILDPEAGHPEKNDLIHFSISVEERDFDQLGASEKEKQERLKEVIREGMKGMAEELNLQQLTWVAGIHRNSDHPHAHVVMRKEALERGTGREKRIGRIRKALLPHRETQNGEEIIVQGRIGDRFQAALEKQQALHLSPAGREQIQAQEILERLAARIQKGRGEKPERNIESPDNERPDGVRQWQAAWQKSRSGRITDREHLQIATSWNEQGCLPEDDFRDYRIALGKRLEFNMRLAFTEVWYDRAVDRGETFRFNVVDQSFDEERQISELDVERRAAARATRISQGDRTLRNEAIDADLSRHGETLQQLSEAREAKVAALGKDLAGLSGKLAYLEESLSIEPPNTDRPLTPLLDRQKLTELQAQAIKLNLPEQVSELEKLRIELAREYHAPTRTDTEAAQLAAQLNIARAGFMARDARLENFEASLHLTTYEVHDERWSLGALDKQIARRQDDAKLIPQRAARLDLRSLARLNYSAAERQQAVDDVKHLTFVRSEIVRQIERRGEPLVADRDLARNMLDILEQAYLSEQRARARDGNTMSEPKYDPHQIRALEASAETLRDSQLLREVHEWEKMATKHDPEINWEGRAVAREVMSGLAVEETKERLQHFLESKRVASLHLGDHQTGTLREVQARTLTEYLANAILDTREQREHRHSVKTAAREHHGRLINDFGKASDYHAAARELASEAQNREPKFTDKEKINVEIYAERQNDAAERERYLELARGESHSQERAASASRDR